MEKKKHYKDVAPSPDFAKLEENILKFWQESRIFEKSVENRADAPEFVFYDGPPFANGLPHYGHLLTGFVKDLFPRYQTMLGRKVERRFGWDCHGLPAEMGVEKELGISGRAAIQKYGIDKFNNACRADVMKYAGEWEKYVNRQARWVDFKNDYKTMDRSFMEAVMWAFKQLFDKGLMYEAMRVMPYSWAAETPLSNFETRLDNSYRERADKAVTVAFELTDGRRILAWTTTPWTLPSNLALAVHPDFDYAEKDGQIALSAYFKLEEGEQLKTFKGKELLGLHYEPLFPYFAGRENSFKIISGDFIEEGSGTGVVHIAPGFGEDDFRVAQENDIKLVVPVDGAGRFTDEIYDLPHPNPTYHQIENERGTLPEDAEDEVGLSLKGRNVFEANDDIIKYLKASEAWVKTEQIIHNYPHCWRTDQPLIYRAMPSWYVEVTKFKDRMVELNQKVNWNPEHVRDGLFGKWLEGARDWSISRNRFWGAPIPIWRSKSGKLHCVGSPEELEKLSGKKVTDLHRPYIDEIKFTIDGEEYTRVEDVLDCWFESGSMPFASRWRERGNGGSGMENGEKSGSRFPIPHPRPPQADFIVEYTAQTRGWFYTMTVLGVALFDEIPFKNVICHGVVLGEPMKDPSTGKMVAQKLSKRLKNYPEPMDVFHEYGADALRWFMLSSPIMRGAELTIDKDGKFIRDIIRLYIKPIWNAYNFFTLYANADGIKAQFKTESSNLMDKYILSKCAESVENIQKSLNAFDTPGAYSAIEQFFEVLNNWYIRRSKERFWSSEQTPDKQAAYDTLYSVLHIICRAAAPLLPFITEEIYKNLTGEESVHLADYPVLDKKFTQEVIDDGSYAMYTNMDDLPYKKIVYLMDKVRSICNSALSIRSAANIRVRQPLQKLVIVGDVSLIEVISSPLANIIAEEVNIKEIVPATNIADFAEYKLKINFPALGKRLPEKMKAIIPAAKKNEWNRLPNGHVQILGEELTTEECELLLEPKNKDNSAPLASQDALVVLDLNLTPELINEGLARDVVRMVQQARKDANLNITDRIELKIETKANIIDFSDYIKDQTLAKTLELGAANGKHVFENELDGEKIKIGLSVA